ncbi:MAG TPA: hypothetical protein VGR20_11360 [Acidimicrobiia bacterium]|jgi:hypothetical protein|nr:hypothetical protein [Acidimicrobiia bacterium]
MKRLFLALAFGITAYAIAFASAATIGTVTDGGVGSGNTVVASCDTDGVNTGYGTAYSATTPGYNVTTVSVTSINTACNGKAISVTVAKSDGSTPATGTGSVASGAANNIAVSPAIPAGNAGAVYVVIG